MFFSSLEEASYLELGFSTFFLNRTNRSGIINAGIIGGKDQTGEWKIDARYNKKDLISRIERIAAYGDRIALYNLDAGKLIKELQGKIPKKTLFYFDPPYYVKGKELYVNYYKHDDHADIAKKITSLNNYKWIVSYDNALPIKRLYKSYKQKTYSLNYSAAEASVGSEVMIFSKDLRVPRIINPTRSKS